MDDSDSYWVFPRPCLEEAHLREYWRLLEESRTAAAVFYDPTTRPFGAEDFIDFASRKDIVFYGLYHGQTPLGFAWLDGFNGLSAHTHFAGFATAFGGHGVNVGIKLLHTVLTTLDGLTTLTGVTPATHRLALRFIKRLGFVSIGSIPHVLNVGGTVTDAVISYCTLQTLNQKRENMRHV